MRQRQQVRVTVYSVMLLCVACQNTSPPASVANTEPSVSNGLFTFSALADGSVRVRPTDTGSSITRVDAIGASMTLSAAAVKPGRTPVEVGSFAYTNFKYQLNGNRDCEWTSSQLIPRCTNQSTQAMQTNQADQAPGVTQEATALPGMTCGAHYQHKTRIWQKQFRVRLAGDAAELAKVKEVRYTIHSSYGKTYVATSLADQFDAGSAFLTPVPSWDVDEAAVVTKTGGQFTLKRVRLSWSDDDPAKKAGTSCE